jgi:DNA-binding NarL/FixJ family response regulator
MQVESNSIALIIADYHPLALAGLREIMSNLPDIRIVGEAGNGDEVKDLVSSLQPRILLLDLKMPNTSAPMLARWIAANYPNTKTIALTENDHDALLSGMMSAGAVGFLCKDERAENLIMAVRRAARGESLFTPEQVQRAWNWNRNEGKKWESLTQRERQALALIEAGLSNSSISERLSIGLKTTEQHVSNVLRKLNVKSRHEAGVWFTKNIPEELRENPE